MNSALTETSTTQAAIVARLSKPDLGFRFIHGEELSRDYADVLLEGETLAALSRLNPAIADDGGRADEILPKLRAAVLAAYDEGLMAANERMMRWLRGHESHQFVGTDYPVPVRLLDFEDPNANSLIVSTEVTFKAGLEKERRYDIVLFVNGFPLVVGETKTPFKEKTSWLNAALDVTNTYEPRTPAFFVPNVLSFATEGKEFRYGSIGTPAEMWQPWGRTDEESGPPGLARVLRSVELLLSPPLLLDILRSFTLYSVSTSALGAQTIKVIPRYPQVEAVELIVNRALDPDRHRGLVWHHQGSGKTMLMAFAAGKLLRSANAPTVVIALDRLDLSEQTVREFSSAGLKLKTADSKDELQRMLGDDDQRGVIVTTIFRFHDSGLLNERSNIVVFCDEAHRTQEGQLGRDLRKALPNATYIGLTGTPISTRDHDTYETFGHPDDPERVLNAYPPERSIADGATLQVIAETRLVDLHIDKSALDEAFEQMAAEEALSDEEKETLARKATKLATLLKAPARIEAVCADILEHYERRIAPLGLKAQIVCYDRELCVLYQRELQRLLDRHGEGWESSVVMTTRGKEDPAEFLAFERDRAAEAEVKRRFRNYTDPLRFLVVTNKLLTGFDAPIEGVMYLDKPLRQHTLFQAITRTNRRWTNPTTGQEKTAGLVVDYIGLGTEIADAVQMRRTEHAAKVAIDDIPDLQARLTAELAETLARFDGIGRGGTAFEALMAAQERLREPDARDDFAREFLTVQALYEFLSPDDGLTADQRDDYRWLAKVYQSVQPATTPDALLWHRLGAKTHALIAAHIGDVEIGAGGPTTIVLDETAIEQLKLLGFDEIPAEPSEPPTAAEVIDSIQRRLDARLRNDPRHAAYRSLAERLDALRQTHIESAEESVQFLKKLLELARELVEADRETLAEGGATAIADTGGPGSLLPDQRIGALTQIFREFAPEATPQIVERVVVEIDAVVTAVRFPGWQATREGDRQVKVEIRAALKKFGLDPTGELFDRAYAYVAEHY